MYVAAIMPEHGYPGLVVVVKDRQAATSERFEITITREELAAWGPMIGLDVLVSVEPLQAAHARDEDPPTSDGCQVAELTTRGGDG